MVILALEAQSVGNVFLVWFGKKFLSMIMQVFNLYGFSFGGFDMFSSFVFALLCNITTLPSSLALQVRNLKTNPLGSP